MDLDAVQAGLARLSTGTLRALGASEVAKTAHRLRLQEQGLWWIEPLLAHQSGEVLGLRRLPGVDSKDWPFVVALGYQALTVASKPASALPMRIFSARLFNLPAGWRSLQPRWSAVVSELRAVHEALGGTDQLDRLDRVVTDDALKESVLFRGGDVQPVELAGARVLRTLDGDTGHGRYRAHLDALLLGTVPLVLDFDVFGAWASAAAANSVVAMQWTMRGEEAFPPACWALLRGPAPLDAAVLRVPSHFPRLSSVPLADQTLLSAARGLADAKKACPSDWTTDPFFDASMALAEHGKSYDGGAHLVAAERLEGSAEPERAFVALQCAAFWSRCNRGNASPDALRAAVALADRQSGSELTPAAP